MGSSNLISVGTTLNDLRRAVQKLASLRLNSDSTHIYASLILDNLTASRLVSSDADKKLVSSDIAAWVLEGSSNQVVVTDEGDGTVTLSTPQNIHAGASPTFANLSLGTGELTAGSINRAAGTLTLEIAGTAEISITSTTSTFGGSLIIPDDGYIGSVTDTDAMQINATGNVEFTQIARGILPTAGDDLATKEYVDLAGLTGRDYWLTDTDDGVIADYHMMYPAETGDGQSTIVSGDMTAGDNQLMFSFITEAGEPGFTQIRPGVYRLHTHLNRGGGDPTTTFYWTLSKRLADDPFTETLLMQSEVSSEINATDPESFETHAALTAGVAIGVTDRLVLKFYGNVTGGGTSNVTITMEGLHDCHLSIQAPSSIWQNQGDVLDDLNTLGEVGADSEFLVGTAAGAFAWESGATVRTSLGLGTGDSPTFTALSLGTGELTCGSINRAADVLTLEITGTPVLSIAAALTTVASRLLVDQDADAIGLEIDSAATSDTNYALSVTTTAGAMVAEFMNGDGNAGLCYLGLLSNNAYSGTYFFSRNLTAASTDCPVVFMVQDHADDDRPVLELKQDGTGTALLISEGGTMTITGGVLLSDAIVIPDDGYIGSVSEPSAIQIAANGVVTFIGAIDTPSDITCGGHLLFDVDNAHISGPDSSPRLVFNSAGNQTENDANSVIALHLAVGGASIDADYGITYAELLTDTDNSDKRGISFELQVTKTAAAMTARAAGIHSSTILDSTNTQNWSNALGGLVGIESHIETEASSAGTIGASIGLLLTSTFADAADVTIYAGIYIETPTVANNKVTTAYGIYIDNIDTAGTNNYSIYTVAGEVYFGDHVEAATTLETGNSITCGGSITVMDGGYLGSVSLTTALQVEAAGNIIMSQNLTVTGTLNSGAITQSGTTLANTYQPLDAELTSLAALSYVAASFVKMTGANTFALRTIGETADDLEGTIVHDNLAGLTIAAHDTTATGANLTSLTDNSIVNTLHRHSELVASDGTPDPALIVDATGQVGIGIAVPLVPLHVYDATSTTPLRLDSLSEFFTSFDLQNSHANAAGTTVRWRPMMVTRKTGGYGGLSAGSFAIRESKDATDHYRFVIDGAGNVGIGIVSPLTLLDIGSDHTVTTPIIRITDTNNGSAVALNDVFGSIEFYTSDTTGNAPLVNASIKCVSGFDGSSGARRADLVFSAYDYDDVAVTEYLRIKYDGKTGIGTSTPATLLTVEGALTLKEQAAADGSTAAYGQLWIKSDGPNILMFTDDAGTDFTVDVTPV